MLTLIFYFLFFAGIVANSDEGTGIDPHGAAPAGVCIDPDGAPCVQSASTDEGNGFDPHG